jgi:hypothetical protein
MDSLQTVRLPAPTVVAPARTPVAAAPVVENDRFTPTQAPVQIFLTPQQAMALCQPDPKKLPATPAPEKSTNDKLKDAIPAPIKMVVDGVPIPGTQAKIKPRFDNGGVTGGPTGLDYKMKW